MKKFLINKKLQDEDNNENLTQLFLFIGLLGGIKTTRKLILVKDK